jgi:hypothetical protein
MKVNLHQWLAPALAYKTSVNFTQLLRKLKDQSPDIVRSVFREYSSIGVFKRKKAFEILFPPSYLSIPVGTVNEQNIQRELFWACSLIQLFANEIRLFLEYKETLEISLLTGDYENSYLQLSNVNGVVSHSLWALQVEILLGQLNGSLEGNKKALKKHSLSTNASILCHFYSMCLEDKVTNDGFDKILNERVEKWQVTYPSFCSYMSFMLDRLSFNSTEKIPKILDISNSNSIIDLYENTINCLQILISARKEDFSPSLIKLITTIASSIGDSRWKIIDNYNFPEKIITTKFHVDWFIPILESYTQDKFDTVIEKCKICLLEKPNRADLYDVYVKSLLSSGKSEEEIIKYLNVTTSDSIINQILHDHYNIVKKNSTTSAALTRIQKLSRVLSPLSISETLHSFCVQQMPVNPKWKKDYFVTRSILNCSGGTPRFSIIFPDQEKKNIFLDKFIDVYGDLSCLKPLKVLVSSSYTPLTVRENLYYNEKLIEECNFTVAIQNLESILSVSVLPIHYEKIVRCLLQAYSKTDDIKKEISLLSDIIISNPFLLQFVDINNVYVRTKDIQIESTLFAMQKAIFVDHYFRCLPDIKKDNTERYNAYTDFLERKNVDKPSDLFKLDHKKYLITNDQMIYFYRYIANSETLEDDWHFDNTDEQRNERILICYHLCEIDKENSETYQQEALKLISKIEINKFIRQADSSKIYVNTTKIIDTLDDNIRENCERLLSLIKLPADLRITKDFQGRDFKPQEKYVKPTYKDSALELFKEIFRKLIDLFVLHDEYGLDLFLSGRIRHGVFNIDLRSIFERNFLITKKSDGQYLRNEYWIGGIDKLDETSELYFVELSERVDKILDFVNSEWIQVATTIELKQLRQDVYLLDSSTKVFRFVMSDDEIEKYFEPIREVQSVEEICMYVFNILWNHTEKCLEEMRWRIENKLKPTLISALTDFQQKIELLDCKHSERLIANINRCRSDLNLSINEVANWFRLSKTITHDDYVLINLINSCVSIYSNWNNDCFKSHVVECMENRTFHARTFQPLFDAIFITLGNIVKHALVKTNTSRISVFTVSDILTIEVTNDLLESTNVIDLKKRLEDEREIYDKSALRKEGRSGFHKMKNILKSFSDPSANFDYKIKDDKRFVVTINLPILELLK